MKTVWMRCLGLAGVLALAVASAGCELLPGTATIVVENNTLNSIEEINISRSVDPGWGQNELSENLGAFDEAEFTVPVGSYDLHAINSNGDTATLFDVRLRVDDVFVWELSSSSFN